MAILVTGVRHRTAPIEVREKFALLEDEVPRALEVLRACAGIQECAILTTCNRTEIYAEVSDTETGLASIRQFYKLFKGFSIEPYRQYTFNLMHEDAVIHLFRVASGLDSLILGEGQILGQVKDALGTAQKAKTAGIQLDRLFKCAITVGKRVRTETGIAEKDVSVSLAAYELAETLEKDLLNKRIALVGGGKMAEILMRCLKDDMTSEQASRITLINRSPERLRMLCDKYGCQGAGWDGIEDAIANADVLFVATGAPHVVLGKADFAGQGNMLIMDISVPRNVDARVAELPNVRLFNTDDLAGVGGFSAAAQGRLKEQAQSILEEEAVNFQQWRMSLSAIPTIARLRAKVETIRQAELAATGAGATETHYQLIDEISRNLIQKILHDPTVRLKTSSNLADIYHQASVLSNLFELDDDVLPVMSAAQPAVTVPLLTEPVLPEAVLPDEPAVR